MFGFALTTLEVAIARKRSTIGDRHMTTQNDTTDSNKTAKPRNRADRRRGGERNRQRQVARGPKPEILNLPVRKRTGADGQEKFVVFVPTDKAGETVIGHAETTRFAPKRGVLTDIDRGTMQPELYQLLVWRKLDSRNRPYCLFRPTDAQIAKLGPDEWLPAEEWVNKRVATLTMNVEYSSRLNRRVPMSNRDGLIVFLEPGSDVVLDKPAVYLLREDGNCAYADFVAAVGANACGSSLVHRQIKKGTVDIEELERIVIETATPDKIAMAKDSVSEPKQPKHMRTTRHYANAYAMLSNVSDDQNRVIITGASSAKEISKASKGKIRRVGPDFVNGYCVKQTGHAASFADLFQANLDQQAVVKAEKAALAILDLIQTGGCVDLLPDEHRNSDDLAIVMAEAEAIDPEAMVGLDENVQDHLYAKLAKEAAALACVELEAFVELPIGQALALYVAAKDARLAKLTNRRGRNRKPKAAAAPVATETAAVEVAPANEATSGSEPTVTESASEGAAQLDSAQG